MPPAFGNATAPANETSPESGDVVGWTVSDFASPGNATAFEIAKNRLNMIVLSSDGGTQVFCNRVGSGSKNGSTRNAGVSLVFVVMAALIAAEVGGVW